MAVLVDYRCTGCSVVRGYWCPSPPPAAGTCEICGDVTRRLFGFRVAGNATDPSNMAASPPAASSCRGNPDVPLLCHVDPAAAPGWIARHRGDNRALDAHLERTESAPPSPTPAVKPGHHHHHH